MGDSPAHNLRFLFVNTTIAKTYIKGNSYEEIRA